MRLIRYAAAALALLASGQAAAQCSGYFDEDYVETGYFASGYLEEGSCVVVPLVIGEASAAAADATLEALGLDLGTATARCSAATLDQVIDQAPPAGTVVPLATLVDVFTSNNTPCEGRPPLWLHLERRR